MHLAAGLSVGLTGLAAGYTIGVVGDVVSADHLHVRAYRASGVNTSEGRSIIHVTVAGIRGHGSDPYFWGGSGAIWVRR